MFLGVNFNPEMDREALLYIQGGFWVGDVPVFSKACRNRYMKNKTLNHQLDSVINVKARVDG